MAWLLRWRAPRSRAPLLFVLLILTLALTAVLAREAHQASVSHHRVAQGVLRDYVEFASWEFARAARTSLSQAFEGGLTASARAIPYGTAASAASEVMPRGLFAATTPNANERCCGHKPPVLTAFRVDGATGRLATRGAPLDEAIARYLVDAHPRLTAASTTDTPCTLLIQRWTPAGTTPIVVGFTVSGPPSRGTGPRELYGFTVDRTFVAGLFEQIVKRRPLLPPTLMRHGEGNAALSVRVNDATGDLLYESPGFEPSTHVAKDTLERLSGRLSYQVALRPSAAEALVIGGLPRSRVGLLLGVLALTTGLILVALVQLRREYELARLRSDFVSGVSHELRTPLAQIRMFSETLLLGRVRGDEEARRSLEIIQQESRRLGHLVDNVLQFSKGHHQAPKLAREWRPLAPLLREVVDAFAPLARARRVTLRFEPHDQVTASVDASALRQIVLNLLDNAVKYGPSGQTVTVSIARHDATARITVDDEGPGIAPTDASRIWAPFARLPQASAAGVAGAGIGLAVVRELTTLHGGRVSVSSSPSGGARFSVELPGAAVPAQAANAQAEERLPSAAAAGAEVIASVRSLSA